MQIRPNHNPAQMAARMAAQMAADPGVSQPAQHAATAQHSSVSALIGQSSGAAHQVTTQFQQQFGSLAQSPSKFHATMSKVFGNSYDYAKAEGFRAAAKNGDFSWLPKIKFVDPKSFPDGGKGAYSASQKTVYLNKELLNNPAMAQKVATEEIGHHLDAQINKRDTPGDEGALFQRVLSGEKLSESQVATLRRENDHGHINVNGQKVAVEFGLFKKIKKGFKKVTGAVKNVVKKVADPVKKAVSGAIGFAKNVGKKVIGGVKKLAGGAIGLVKKAGSAVWNGVKKVGGAVINGVKKAGSAVWNGIKKVGSTIAKGAKGVWNGIKKVASQIGKALGPVMNVLSKFGPAIGAVLSVIAPPLGAAVTALSKVASFAKAGISLVGGKLGGAAGAIKNFIGGNVLGPVKHLVGKAIAPFAKHLSPVASRVKSILNTLATPVKRAVARVVRDPLTRMVQKVYKWVRVPEFRSEFVQAQPGASVRYDTNANYQPGTFGHMQHSPVMRMRLMLVAVLEWMMQRLGPAAPKVVERADLT